ncbi:MAG: MFS transporter [Chloroflexi bacterium]|nr:MFS transporter [Chloroflexota bacterium]
MDNNRWKTPFLAFWIGQVLSLFGSQVVQFALVWWLTQKTGSATVLTTATLVVILPGVLLGPFAGALVDRWNRRIVMITADSLIALAVLGMIYLFWSNTIQVWHIYAMMFFRSSAGIFHFPAMQASTSLMVPEKHLSRVAGMNQVVAGLLNIASPPFGALLLGVLPLYGVLSIDIITAGLAVGVLFFIAIPQPARTAVSRVARSVVTALFKDVWMGLRYVSAWPGLTAIIIIATLLNFLLNPAFALIPLLVTKHFGGGVTEIGWVDSAWGIGIVAGALILSAWGGFKRRMLTATIALVGMGIGVSLVGIAPAPAFWLGLFGVFFTGLMNPFSNGPIMAMIQAKVSPEMQGRVLSLIISGASAIQPIGMLAAGPVADHFGLQLWYIAGGVVCTIMGVTVFFIPTLMRFEDQHAPSMNLIEAAEKIVQPDMMTKNV